MTARPLPDSILHDLHREQCEAVAVYEMEPTERNFLIAYAHAVAHRQAFSNERVLH